MRVKDMLLATSALSTLALAGPAHASGLYVSVFGGANWNGDASAFESLTSVHPGTISHTTAHTTIGTAAAFVEDQKGFVVGGAVGVGLDTWVKGLRAEAEMSYRRNKLSGAFRTSVVELNSGIFSNFTGAEGSISGHASTFAVLANVWYDINIGTKVTPYIGGGAGWARTNVNLIRVATFGSPDTTQYNDEKSGFAYQLGAGFNYEVAPDVKIGLGYRYFNGPDADKFVFAGKHSDATAPLKIENENHSVAVSLTVDIN